jgi:3-oxoacyl-[acyl-carrier protein] reductase
MSPMDANSQFRLVGKRAIVCGSTQGIGLACAQAFAELGAAVTLVARDEAALRRVAASLPTGEEQQHEFLCADFTDPRALAEKVVIHLPEAGAVHILLNNTGGPAHGPIAKARPEQFIEGFNKHVICFQLLTQAVIKGMKEAGYGRIINIISTSVKEPIKGLGVSNTIRAAVANWSKTWANEVAAMGITVNNILPGYTATARLDSLIKSVAEERKVGEDVVRKEVIERIPMGRLARAEEIAAAAAFLASPAASYVTGINLTVDGGRTGCL